MKHYTVRVFETRGEHIGKWGGWSGTFHHLHDCITWADDHLLGYMRDGLKFAVFRNGKLLKKILPMPDPPAKGKGKESVK